MADLRATEKVPFQCRGKPLELSRRGLEQRQKRAGQENPPKESYRSPHYFILLQRDGSEESTAAPDVPIWVLRPDLGPPVFSINRLLGRRGVRPHSGQRSGVARTS